MNLKKDLPIITVYFKNFLTWIEHKILLNKLNRIIPFQEREIWWCSIGVNIGYEIDGKNSSFNRPVLILRKFNQRQFWGIPLTTKTPKNPKYFFKINIKGKTSYLSLSQLRVIDVARLSTTLNKDFKIPQPVFDQINTEVINILQKKSPTFVGSSAKAINN